MKNEIRIGEYHDWLSVCADIPELCQHDWPEELGGVFVDADGKKRCSWCRAELP